MILKNNKFNPVIIIGAPRSGTNILRDSLSKLENVGTWECDEIPYIWAYGNKEHPNDLFKPKMANKEIKKYIQFQFQLIANKTNCSNIIEKTCSNSLRVDFVNKIFPNSKFIYIKRNGYDVVYSIMKRWKSKFDLIYSLKKLKYVPKKDIPYYGYKYLKNRVYQKRNNERLKFWGPRFLNEDKLINLDLVEISAMQWVACIKNSNRSFKNLGINRFFELRYEDFVRNPKNYITNIAEFLKLSNKLTEPVPKITDKNIGKGLKNLTIDQVRKIRKIIAKEMEANKYQC